MRKNKKEWSNLEIFTISVCSFVFLVLLQMWITPNKFNPATDDCDEWDDVKSCTTEKGIISEKAKEYANQERCIFIEDEDGLCCTKCLKWHPKNKCELCSDKGDCYKEVSEGCVCDEYEEITIINQSTITVYQIYGVDKYLMIKWDKILNETQFKKEYSKLVDNCSGNLVRGVFDLCYETGNQFNCVDGCKVNTFERSTSQVQKVKTNVCIKSHEAPKPIKIDLTKEKCAEHSDEIILSKELKEDIDILDSTNCDDVSERLKITPDDAIRNFKSDSYISIKKIYDRYCCLRKEPKNPCKMGNRDYITLEEEYCPKDNVIYEGDWKEVDCYKKAIRTICRKKTECEKNSNEWILAYDEKCNHNPLPKKDIKDCSAYSFYNNTIDWEFYNTCINDYKQHNKIVDEEIKAIEQCKKDNPICRKKQLTDLSCSELLDYYEKGNECVKVKNIYSWEWGPACLEWKYPQKGEKRIFGSFWISDYPDKQILSEYLKRCVK